MSSHTISYTVTTVRRFTGRPEGVQRWPPKPWDLEPSNLNPSFFCSTWSCTSSFYDIPPFDHNPSRFPTSRTQYMESCLLPTLERRVFICWMRDTSLYYALARQIKSILSYLILSYQVYVCKQEFDCYSGMTWHDTARYGMIWYLLTDKTRQE